MMLYRDRQDAGRQLSLLLKDFRGKDAVVYALPRGGVVVAEPIAKYLNAPLDLIFAHKIGHPHHREYAIGAVSENGHLVTPSQELFAMGEAWLKSEIQFQLEEIKRKRVLYLKGRKEVSAKDKIAILVDDGMATGLTMQAGIAELKSRSPKKIIVAVPIASKNIARLIKTMVNDFIGVEVDDDQFLGAVGAYYNDFRQVEDDEVIDILHHSIIF